MEDLIKKVLRAKRGKGYRSSGTRKKLKRTVLIVAFLALLITVSIVTLAIVGIVWLFNRGDQVKQAGQGVTSQVQTLAAPLNLDSYVTNNQVNVEQLSKNYESIPAPLQDVWLGQFKTQLDELRQQANVSTDVLQSLTALYNSLRNG